MIEEILSVALKFLSTGNTVGRAVLLAICHEMGTDEIDLAKFDISDFHAVCSLLQAQA